MAKRFHDEYPLLLKYRPHIMAVAILWIVFFHSGIPVSYRGIQYIKNWGYGGVDIFLFLSGMGLYYSLKNNSLEAFYRKRISRILPSYLPFIVIWFLFRHFVAVFVSKTYVDKSITGIIVFFSELLGNVTGVGWLAGLDNQFNWYISMLLVTYLLAPVVYIGVRYMSKKKVRYFIAALIYVSVCVVFLGKEALIGVSRIAIFVVGMLAAHSYSEENDGGLPRVLLYVMTVVGVAILYAVNVFSPNLLWEYGLYWFPFLLITPGLCLLLVRLFEFINKFFVGEKFLKVIKTIGTATFEIYLVHIALFSLIVNVYILDQPTLWLIWIVAGVIGGIVYKQMIVWAIGFIRKR